MEHEYYQTCAGFAPCGDFNDYVDIVSALDFLSHSLGLTYLTNLETMLDLNGVYEI